MRFQTGQPDNAVHSFNVPCWPLVCLGTQVAYTDMAVAANKAEQVGLVHLDDILSLHTCNNNARLHPMVATVRSRRVSFVCRMFYRLGQEIARVPSRLERARLVNWHCHSLLIQQDSHGHSSWTTCDLYLE